MATQVIKSLQALLGAKSPIKSALLIGGDSLPKQLTQLRNKPRLIVGTPGRINDLLERGNLNLNDTKYLVLDETDRMLDMGFSIQINSILKHMKGDRQTMLFSATLPNNIMQLAGRYLNDPKRISVGTVSNPAENVAHKVEYVSQAKKYDKLMQELDERHGSVIVFVKTKAKAERIAKKLNQYHHADGLHGDLRHTKRERVTHAFRQGKFRVLVATDIAARGLDIPHIEHVINYDLPQCPEDYVHRIGRTGRAGKTGEAVCFVAPEERGMWGAIYRLMYPNADRIEDENQPVGKGKGKGKGRNSRNRNERRNNRDGEHRNGKNRNRRDNDKRDNKKRHYDDKNHTDSDRDNGWNNERWQEDTPKSRRNKPDNRNPKRSRSHDRHSDEGNHSRKRFGGNPFEFDNDHQDFDPMNSQKKKFKQRHKDSPSEKTP